MKLTGKTLIAFQQWYDYPLSKFQKLDNVCQNALIVDWFDSVGIYVNVLKYEGKWKFIVNMQYRQICDSRTEAANAAIEKANVIYNESK